MRVKRIAEVMAFTRSRFVFIALVGHDENAIKIYISDHTSRTGRSNTHKMKNTYPVTE